MSYKIVNQSPYVRTSRSYPKTAEALSIELDKAYIETAQALNDRVIGIYPLNRAAVTGKGWFISGTKQEALRQVYTFTAAGNIAHGIDTAGIYGFSQIYGTVYDGTNWYPLPVVDAASSTNQIAIYVDSTNIVITAGAGTPPTISSGIVVLEWIVQP